MTPRYGTHPHAQAAGVLAGLVCRVADVDAVVAIVYDCDFLEDHHSLIAAIERQAHACGLRVLDLLYVTAEGYGRVGETARPLAEVEPVEVNGCTVNTDDQHAGSILPAPDYALMDAALGCDVRAILQDRARFATTSEAIATGAPVDAETMAFAVAVCERPSLRDIFLVGVTGGPEAAVSAWNAQQAWEQGADYPADLARVMWGEGARPDPSRLTAVDTFLRHLVAGEDSLCPGSLATLAWVSWALGRSTIAADYAGTALTIDPDHGLAGIVASFIQAGHLPAWAFTN